MLGRIVSGPKIRPAPRPLVVRATPDDELRREADAFWREKERLMEKSIESSSASVGGEYGEEFAMYTFSHDIRVDVDLMNERLRSKGALRHRFALKPDEAFALIFDLDEVIIDTRELMKTSWRQLAAEKNLPLPSIERPQIYQMRAERAILDVLQWTKDFREAQRLAFELATIYAGHFAKVSSAPAGVATYLEALRKANIPLACVSSLDRYTMSSALERVQLRQYFTVLASLDDGFENKAQLLLGAAWNLGRAPNNTAYVCAAPSSIRAGHNVTMKAISIQGQHASWELKGSDLICTKLSDLTVYNIRKLFANRGSELMDTALQRAAPPPKNRRLWTDTIDPDDE